MEAVLLNAVPRFLYIHVFLGAYVFSCMLTGPLLSNLGMKSNILVVYLIIAWSTIVSTKCCFSLWVVLLMNVLLDIGLPCAGSPISCKVSGLIPVLN